MSVHNGPGEGTWSVGKKMDRYFPDVDECGHRKGVCRRCHVVMFDVEPESSYGQFYHPRLDKKGKLHWCPNAGKCLNTQDKELEPFLRKAERRRNKRIRRWMKRAGSTTLSGITLKR